MRIVGIATQCTHQLRWSSAGPAQYIVAGVGLVAEPVTRGGIGDRRSLAVKRPQQRLQTAHARVFLRRHADGSEKD